jgi:CheY-like chemotaxis protein
MKDRLACVLLDLTMPEMDGREVLEELRRIHRGIPVIISSGYSENQVLTLFSDEKPDAFIPKPYDFASLICSLRRVLEENAEEDRS